jgi:hypothetical protein
MNTGDKGQRECQGIRDTEVRNLRKLRVKIKKWADYTVS